jgi:hypothetical protein
MLVPTNAKFAALMLSRCAGAEEIPGDIEVAPGIRAAQRLNVEFEPHWREWLGRRTFAELHEEGLVVYVTAPAERPEVLDADNHALIQRIHDIFHGLTLQGVPAFSKGFVVTGANVTGEIRVRQYDMLKHIERTFGFSFRVGAVELRRAIGLASRIRTIQDAGEGQWGRLLRAARILLEANGESNTNGERLHQLVRSVDGLIRAEPGQNRRMFGHRVQTFARASPTTRDVLLELYDLRGLVEHLNVPTDLFPSGTETERRERVNRGTRQADALARFAILRILESERMFEAFRTDDQIDEFWRLDGDVRVSLWGDRLDIRSIE